jgi:hypothetical protein
MTERTTRHSFIVRVYRIDTKDCRKLTGLVEAMDGSGERAPFIDIDELAALLSRGAGKRTGRKKITDTTAKRKARSA